MTLARAAVLAQAAADTFDYANETDAQIQTALTTAYTNVIGGAGNAIAASWGATWNDGSGTLTLSNGTAAIGVSFSKLYTPLPTEQEVRDALDGLDLGVRTNVVTKDQLKAYLLAELSCLSKDLTVSDFFHLHAVPGAKDETGILVAGRDGYAAAVVSITGSAAQITKTWKIAHEDIVIGDYSDSTSKDSDFTISEGGNYTNLITGYTGNAKKLIIPNLSGNILGNWDVPNKANVEVVIINNTANALSGETFKDFVNLKVVVMSDTVTGVHNGGSGVYGKQFTNCPELAFMHLSEALIDNYDYVKEHPKLVNVNFPAAIKNLGYLTLQNIAVRDYVIPNTPNLTLDPGVFRNPSYGAGTRTFVLTGDNVVYTNTGVTMDTAFDSGSALCLTLVLSPVGSLTSGGADTGNVSFIEPSLCSAFVMASLTADAYDGAAASGRVRSVLENAYQQFGDYGVTTKSWNWTVPTAASKTVSGALTLQKDGAELAVNFIRPYGGAVSGTTVKERVQNALDEYKYTNSTTEEDILKAIAPLLPDGYSLGAEEFYNYKAVGGAKDSAGILVEGHNGYVRAVVTLTNGTDSEKLLVSGTIEPELEMFAFASVSDPSDFELSDDGKTLLSYNGSAEKVVIPEGVETIDIMWLGNTDPSKVRALILPESLTELPFAMCEGMTRLQVAYMGDNVQNNGDDGYAFYKTYALKYVRLSENLTQIPEFAFYECISLAQIYIPQNIRSVSEQAFITSLVRDVTLSVDVTRVGQSAFENPVGPIFPSERFVLSDADFLALMPHINTVCANQPYRNITVLNPDMRIEQNAFVSWLGNSSSPIVVYAPEGSTAQTGINADPRGVIFEPLDMTFSEAATRAQIAADGFYPTNSTTAAIVKSAIAASYLSSAVKNIDWANAFALTPSTESEKGRVTGALRLTRTDNLTADVDLDRPVFIQLEEREPGGNTPDSGDSGNPENPGNGPVTGSNAAKTMAAAGLLSVLALAGLVLIRRKKLKA
jgi:LPXTG-motif cell wall-anchored protein